MTIAVHISGFALILTLPMTTTTSVLPQYVRCYNNPMDKVLCDAGTQIQIHSAFYLDTGAGWGCSDNQLPQNPCRANIAAANQAYYREILQKCNGKRSCEGLKAGKASTDCNYWANPSTDMVLLEYTCNADPINNSTRPDDGSHCDTNMTTWETSESTTADPGISSRQQGVPTAILIAVPVVVALIVLGIILLLIFFLRRRRKSQIPSEQSEKSTQQTIYNNAIYANSDVIDGSTYPYDKAATVVIPSRKRDPENENLQSYMEMSSPTDSNKLSQDTKPTEKPKERIYSLEKAPSPTDNMYQPFESPYTEPTPKPRDGTQYMRMTGCSPTDPVGPYSEVGQPTKLEDLEGVYSVPRNSDRVVDGNSIVSSSDECLDEPPPVPPSYENVYENRQVAGRTEEPGTRREAPEAEYSEVGPRQHSDRKPGHQNIFSVSSDTMMIENETYE